MSAKEVINKHELQVFHQELSKHLEKALGHSVGILNGETKNGNRSIAELKEKSALERAEKAEEQAKAAEARLSEKNAQYIATAKQLEELNGKVLSAQELKAIEGKKSIGGALKNVSWEEWQSVKNTAEQATAENAELKKENQRLQSENKRLSDNNTTLRNELTNPLSKTNQKRLNEKTDNQNQIRLLKKVLRLDGKTVGSYDELRRELIQRGYVQPTAQNRNR